MKYSEYLKLVKAQLAAPDEVPNKDGTLRPHPICYANSDALSALRFTARQAKDKAMEVQAEANSSRLDAAVANALHEINRQLPEYAHARMYPTALYSLLVHRGEPNPPDPTRSWGQQVRHALLDKWIAEAEQRESSHG